MKQLCCFFSDRRVLSLQGYCRLGGSRVVFIHRCTVNHLLKYPDCLLKQLSLILLKIAFKLRLFREEWPGIRSQNSNLQRLWFHKIRNFEVKSLEGTEESVLPLILLAKNLIWNNMNLAPNYWHTELLPLLHCWSQAQCLAVFLRHCPTLQVQPMGLILCITWAEIWPMAAQMV